MLLGQPLAVHILCKENSHVAWNVYTCSNSRIEIKDCHTSITELYIDWKSKGVLSVMCK